MPAAGRLRNRLPPDGGGGVQAPRLRGPSPLADGHFGRGASLLRLADPGLPAFLSPCMPARPHSCRPAHPACLASRLLPAGSFTFWEQATSEGCPSRSIVWHCLFVLLASSRAPTAGAGKAITIRPANPNPARRPATAEAQAEAEAAAHTDPYAVPSDPPLEPDADHDLDVQLSDTDLLAAFHDLIPEVVKAEAEEARPDTAEASAPDMAAASPAPASGGTAATGPEPTLVARLLAMFDQLAPRAPPAAGAGDPPKARPRLASPRGPLPGVPAPKTPPKSSAASGQPAKQEAATPRPPPSQEAATPRPRASLQPTPPRGPPPFRGSIHRPQAPRADSPVRGACLQPVPPHGQPPNVYLTGWATRPESPRPRPATPAPRPAAPASDPAAPRPGPAASATRLAAAGPSAAAGRPERSRTPPSRATAPQLHGSELPIRRAVSMADLEALLGEQADMGQPSMLLLCVNPHAGAAGPGLQQPLATKSLAFPSFFIRSPFLLLPCPSLSYLRPSGPLLSSPLLSSSSSLPSPPLFCPPLHF